MQRDEAVLRVTVSDNGKGLSQRGDSENERFGLMGMRERVQALGGEFALQSQPGAGLTVVAAIPIQQMAATEADTDDVQVASR